MYQVAVNRYEDEYSLKNTLDLLNVSKDLHSNLKVFIKPNFAFWLDKTDFPKFGVITTAQIIEDLVVYLSESGVTDITVIEGIVNEQGTEDSMLKSLIYGMNLIKLSNKYGVKFIDVNEGKFRKVNVDGININISEDIYDADYIINLPVLKTHRFCKTSLGIKNLKGLIDIRSRQSFHAIKKNHKNYLSHAISKLPEIIKSDLVIIDGIYSLEYGSTFSGKGYRSNMLIASKDIISADVVGSKLLGYEAKDIPVIKETADALKRKCDLSDIEILGDKLLLENINPLRYAADKGDKGYVNFRLFRKRGIRTYSTDESICTYCCAPLICILTGIINGKRRVYDDVEILFGKHAEPSGECRHTILVGGCQVRKNKNNKNIKNCITLKGCPAETKNLLEVLDFLDMQLPVSNEEWITYYPEFLMKKYNNSDIFDRSHFYL
ncbi:MAG TPA: DUF362 domain-containing protein [Victivallales bacterium]|nr:DUF362 domain-containing protein [Victivallales bacterium]